MNDDPLQGVPEDVANVLILEPAKFHCITIHLVENAKITHGIIRKMRRLLHERKGGDVVYAVCVPRGSQAARLAELAGMNCKHPYRPDNLIYTSPC